jgi:Glyceraldehyde-3-phosphate dehydrogenase/erythrose-4-phosphate dehydrogenase
MAVKIAINGFGRIGRLVFRAIAEQGLIGKDVEVVAVGDIVPADNLAYLLKYDSTQGRFQGEVSSKKSSADKTEDDVLIVNGKEIKVVSAKTPAELPWKALGVQIVIEPPACSPTRRRIIRSPLTATSWPGPRRSSSPRPRRTRTSRW